MIDYTSEQRAIFQYHDGVTQRWADPDTINRRLFMACPDFDEQLRLTKKVDDLTVVSDDRRAGMAAEEKVIAAARTAFGMPCNPAATTPEEYGATEAEVRTALRTFLDFLKKKEKPAVVSPTLSPPSASGRMAPSPTTKRTSASP